MSLVSLKRLIFSSPKRNDSSRLPHYDESATSWSSTRSRHSATPSDSIDESVYSSDHLLDEKHYAESEEQKKKTRIDPRVISDAIIGLSDGLTVPFALTAGLSAFGSTKLVIFGGLAELIAGAISMGLGGYLAARSEAEAYDELQQSTRRLVNGSPQKTATLVRKTLLSYIPSSLSNSSAVDGLASQIVEHSNTEQLTSFLLALHHRTSSPDDSRSALTSAGTIAAGYFVGGFIALFPYFFTSDVGQGFWWSVAIMALALFAFGFTKTWCVCSPDEDDDFEENDSDAGDGSSRSQWRRRRRGRALAETVRKCSKGGAQMVVLGGVAATAAMGLVKAFS